MSSVIMYFFLNLSVVKPVTLDLWGATLGKKQYTRAIQKVTSSELLTIQAMETRLLHAINMYILKILLNIVPAGIEAFISGNEFLYSSVKKVCHLGAQPCFETFHQLPIIAEAL
jgi:hypothetical protein